MGCSAAALGGFVVGSIFTAVVYHLLINPEEKSKKEESFNAAITLASSRGLRSGADLAVSEQINFLSDLVSRLWVHLCPAIGDTIRAIVEPMFKEMMPGPLKSLHFTKCDLGRVPFRFDNIVVHSLKDGTVQFDLDVVWDGKCDIQLKAGAIKLGVRNIKLIGRMQFLMKPLSDVLPCVGAIQYAFINVPTIELDFTGLANVADFSGIDKMIRGILNDVIAGMMVLPNRMLTKMDFACDFRDAFVPPVGIARITAMTGRGFEIEKRFGFKDDIPDVYLNVKLGDKVWKTSVQKDSLTPQWNEAGDFLLSDRDQILEVHAWDEDIGRFDADDDLGMANMTIAEMLLAGKVMEVELQNDKNIGTGAFVTLHCEILKLNVNPRGYDLSPPPNRLSGVLTIMVTKAFDLPLSKEKAESFVKVKYGSHEFVTGMVIDIPGIDCLNPTYDMSFLVPISRELVEKGFSDVIFELMNGSKKPSKLGSINVSHKSLLAAPGNKIKGTRGIGNNGAILEFQVSLQSTEEVDQMAVSSTALRLSTKIETVTAVKDKAKVSESQSKKVRVTVKSAQGFQKRKKKMFKKSDIPDVYCTVKFGSSPKIWRTSTIKDNTSPEWNESEVYNLANERQVIKLEAWDANKKGGDTFLGSFRVAVGKVLLSSGKIEMELKNDDIEKGAFVTLLCELE